MSLSRGTVVRIKEERRLGSSITKNPMVKNELQSLITAGIDKTSSWCVQILISREKDSSNSCKNDKTIRYAAFRGTYWIEVRNVTVLCDVWGNAVSHRCAVAHCARGMAGGLHGKGVLVGPERNWAAEKKNLWNKKIGVHGGGGSSYLRAFVGGCWEWWGSYEDGIRRDLSGTLVGHRS